VKKSRESCSLEDFEDLLVKKSLMRTCEEQVARRKTCEKIALVKACQKSCSLEDVEDLLVKKSLTCEKIALVKACQKSCSLEDLR